MSWLVNNAPAHNSLISEDGDRHFLTITRAVVLDAGTVTCIAENTAGRAASHAKLTVHGKLFVDF